MSDEKNDVDPTDDTAYNDGRPFLLRFNTTPPPKVLDPVKALEALLDLVAGDEPLDLGTPEAQEARDRLRSIVEALKSGGLIIYLPESMTQEAIQHHALAGADVSRGIPVVNLLRAAFNRVVETLDPELKLEEGALVLSANNIGK